MNRNPLDALEKIVDLATNAEQNFITLGRLLRQVKDADPNLFKAAIEQSGLSRRAAYYLVRVVKHFEGMPIEDAELAAIGWTRAEIIAPHLTIQNCKHLVAQASALTTRDLKITMAGGRPVPGTRAVVLYLKPTQYARFAKAIAAHGGKSIGGGLTNKERALMNLIAAAEQVAK
jgi:hypothetical protein